MESMEQLIATENKVAEMQLEYQQKMIEVVEMQLEYRQKMIEVAEMQAQYWSIKQQTAIVEKEKVYSIL